MAIDRVRNPDHKPHMDVRTPSITVSPARALSRARAYLMLTKPRIVELLLVTTIPTMILAAGGIPSIWLMIATVIGGSLAAGGANAFNCWYDRDIDAKMQRTRNRPIPSGEITAAAGLRFAIGLEVAAVLWLGLTVNVLSAVLALSAALFYAFVYTIGLKRSTAQNIVIGGAAGAVPVLIGWAAVDNAVPLPAWLLFLLIFYWTPPHFWALSIKYRDDYAAADVPMLPVVAGIEVTARQILRYALLMVVISLLFGAVAQMGLVYLVTTLVLGGVFLFFAADLRRKPTVARAMRLFHYSISYLFLLFVAVAVDTLIPF